MKQVLSVLAVAFGAIAHRVHDLLFAHMARAGLVQGLVLLSRPYAGYAANTIVQLAASEESSLVAQGLASTSAGPVTPGAVTTTKGSGRVGIAAGQSSVVISNPSFAAESKFAAALSNGTADTTALYITRIVPAAGQVTIVVNANATAAISIDWAQLSPSGMLPSN